MNINRLIIFIIFSLLSFLSSAQRKLGLEADNWATELTKAGLTEVNSMGALSNLLIATDSTRALSFLDSVETSSNAKGYFFISHFCMVKAQFLFDKFIGPGNRKNLSSSQVVFIKNQMTKLYKRALDAAYHTEDDATVGWVSFYSARLMLRLGETSWGVMYSKNGVEMLEKKKYPVETTVYIDLADLLHQVREYDECILYAKKGLVAWIRDNEFAGAYRYKIKALNILGTTNYEKNRPDSAIKYYQQALEIARQNKDTLWTGMILGNIGKLMYAQNKFDSAYSLFKIYFQNSKKDSIYNNAANALQWAARANLARGNKVSALADAREAIYLLSLWPSSSYLRDTYYTLTQVFRATGNYDSAFYYSDRYIALNDSLEKEIATNSLAISKARLNDEISRFDIQKLNREKEAALLWRNIIIGSIIILSLIALLIINRRFLKQKIKAEKAEQEKKIIEKEKLMMEQQMNAAKDQLKMFTANIVEKANLIEKLEAQIQGKAATVEQQEIITELSKQTILTEDDWYKFKSLFEKVYPGFFINLISQFPDITIAEQRMAALIRLYLSPKQIASMLGISVDSVHKSRQRLRQRFQVQPGANLEELVAKL